MLVGKFAKQWRRTTLVLLAQPVFTIRFTAGVVSPVVSFARLNGIKAIKSFETDHMGRKYICQITFDNDSSIWLQFSNKAKMQAWTNAVGRAAIELKNASQLWTIPDDQVIDTLSVRV
eukprot:jgi/Hompol1/718/HPOL_005394-RA